MEFYCTIFYWQRQQHNYYIRLAEEPVFKPYWSNQVKLEGGSHNTRSNVDPNSTRYFTVFYVSFPQAPVIQRLVSNFQYQRISGKLIYSRLQVLTKVKLQVISGLLTQSSLVGNISYFSVQLIYIYHGASAPKGPRPPHCRGFTITLRHTIRGRTPLDEWSARRRDLYLKTHNTHKR